MEKEQLIYRCEILFGKLWQSQLARFVGVDSRTVRYWVSGKSAIPHKITEVLRILEDAKSAITYL